MFYDEQDYSERRRSNVSLKIKVGMAAIGAALLGTAILSAMCVYRIAPGYAGVVYNMDGGIEDEVVAQGYTVTAPWKKIIEYPVSTETVYYSKNREGDDDEEDKDTSIFVNTKDGKQVSVDVTYTYHMNPDQLPHIFTRFRGQNDDLIEAGIMKNEMYQAVNDVTSQYSLMDLVGDKRPEVNAKIFTAFAAALKDDGIVIETFNLSNVRPDEATQQAIQNVVNAQNALAQSKVEKEKAEIEAEQARVTAKGKADAAAIEAEGQAQANAKLQATLTPLIIEQKRIEKWDGALPKYSGNSNAAFLLKE